MELLKFIFWPKDIGETFKGIVPAISITSLLAYAVNHDFSDILKIFFQWYNEWLNKCFSWIEPYILEYLKNYFSLNLQLHFFGNIFLY